MANSKMCDHVGSVCFVFLTLAVNLPNFTVQIEFRKNANKCKEYAGKQIKTIFPSLCDCTTITVVMILPILYTVFFWWNIGIRLCK